MINLYLFFIFLLISPSGEEKQDTQIQQNVEQIILAKEQLRLDRWTAGDPTDHAKAVSIDDIKSVGIITGDLQGCDNSIPVNVFADPELTQMFDSIASHSFVKYDRLSVLTGKPYWAPRGEHALPSGEKFKIYGDSIMGWVDGKQLLTFSSAWRERNTNNFFAIDRNTVVCLYSSGQYESSYCVALTVWRKSRNYENIWVLKAIDYSAVGAGYLSLPKVDGLLRYKDGNLAIQISVRGGDEGDVWGAFNFFLFHNGVLIKSLVKGFNYNMFNDYIKTDCEMILNKENEPTVLIINRHFIFKGMSTPPVLSAIDTSIVQLLDQTKKHQ